jgi:hypothetical protein
LAKKKSSLVALAATVALGSVVLFGCSSGPSPNAHALKTGVTVPLDANKNARADVKTGTCAPESGTWVLNGTVKNPTSKPATFQIVVDFVTQKGFTVLSSSVVNVPNVAPGDTTSWSAKGAAGQSGVECLIRQAQTT